MLRLKGKRQQSTPNLRSVGAKPYDFNRLKYTTSYRAFGRKSLPHIDRLQSVQNCKQIITLNINITERQKQQAIKISSRKKISKMIDKWKQRYEIPYNSTQQNQPKKRSIDHFPPITKINPIHTPLILLSTKSKFDIYQFTQKKLKKKVKINVQKVNPERMTDEQVQQIFRKYQSVPNIDNSKSSLQQNTNDDKNQELQNIQSLSSYAKRLRYSLQVQRKLNNNLKKKANERAESLQLVQQIPQRWQINGDQDNEETHQKYNGHAIIQQIQ